MKQPPEQNRRCNHKQAECLVAPESPMLLFATLLLGHLLVIRFDPGFHHPASSNALDIPIDHASV
jgi:hypothetical protein